MESKIKSPGVYINEQNAFSNSVASVATAVPAFIGYTPQAVYQGKSYTNVPLKITSFQDFQDIYCYPDPVAPANPAIQYQPEYYLVEQKSQPSEGMCMVINGSYHSILPDPNTIYYLYNSIKLFYQNGGGDAYIVSVGTYGPPSKQPIAVGAQIINPNVVLSQLQSGLALLLNEPEPTMYICPEATLLAPSENAVLMKSMLAQNQVMQTAISIFDLIGGRNPNPLTYTNDIDVFRASTGEQGLDYGTAYYPFIGTTIMGAADINYNNIFGGDVKLLEPLLNTPFNPNPTVVTILQSIENPIGPPLTVSQYHNLLLNASKIYSNIIKNVLLEANILPASGAMAGVMTTIDNQYGVWEAPANTSIVGAASLTINLSESQQGNLNVDPISGKSINAIRFFNGIGILVWGARTLDGNSQDWRYISVKRTMIMLEQSCKLAAQPYVFQPNVMNTWAAVKAMISSFLTTIWKEGGLQGASASDAFSVACGLGTTMTPDDILNGFMKVTVKVAVVRPAEFIVFTIQQEMQASS